MIPFRDTVERVWLSRHDLYSERRDEREYKVVMGPHLYADFLGSDGFWHYGTPQRAEDIPPTVMGFPIEIDRSLPRGWISLRHEVIR